MLEEYEEVVEDWYFHHQEQKLERFLCGTHILKDSDQGEEDQFLIHSACLLLNAFQLLKYGKFLYTAWPKKVTV